MRKINRRGISMTESLLMAPLFFAFVFGLLQAAYLGGALLIANYSANSIARRAVGDNINDAGIIKTAYESDFEHFMMGGLKPQALWGCPVMEDTTPTSKSFTVNTVVKVMAFPFMRWILAPALKETYSGAGLGNCDLNPPPSIGPFYFSGNLNQFLVRGKSTIRTNYQP